MLKSLTLATLGIILTTGAFANVSFKANYLRTECIISNGEVTRTMAFGKEKDLKFTEVTKLSFQGLEAYARRAASTSTGQDSNDESVYEMNLDGTQYILNTKDSADSLALVQMIVKACKING